MTLNIYNRFLMILNYPLIPFQIEVGGIFKDIFPEILNTHSIKIFHFHQYALLIDSISMILLVWRAYKE